MNIKRELETKVGIANSIYLNNIDIPPLTIKAIMINEVVPSDPLQDFYGLPDADYLKTTIPLLQGAGTAVTSIQDILQMWICNGFTPFRFWSATIDTTTPGESLQKLFTSSPAQSPVREGKACSGGAPDRTPSAGRRPLPWSPRPDGKNPYTRRWYQ